MSESTAHSDPGYPAALIVYYISLYAFYSQSLDHHPLFWLGTVWPPFFLKKRVIILLNNSKRWNWEALEFRLVIVPGQGRWMLVKSELFMHCTHHPPGSVQPGHGPLLQHHHTHTHSCMHGHTHVRSTTCTEWRPLGGGCHGINSSHLKVTVKMILYFLLTMCYFLCVFYTIFDYQMDTLMTCSSSYFIESVKPWLTTFFILAFEIKCIWFLLKIKNKIIM